MALPPSRDASPGTVIKVALGGGSLFFAAAAWLADRDAGLWAASGLLGALWAWVTFFVHDIGQPLGRWMRSWYYGSVDETPGLSLDDNIRLLESRLADPNTPRRLQIRSAMRLEEIYRLNRNDPQRAREMIGLIRQRFPDARELKIYDGPTGRRADGT
jgi:hypothetical protein